MTVTYSAISSLLLRSATETRSFSHMKINFGYQHCYCVRPRLPGNKSGLLACINPSIKPEPLLHFDAKILDGAAMWRYSDTIFIPWTELQLQNSTRRDIVWDRYYPDSLKSITLEKLGKGYEGRCLASFAGFLQDCKIKEELFALLSEVTNHVYLPEKWVYNIYPFFR